MKHRLAEIAEIKNGYQFRGRVKATTSDSENLQQQAPGIVRVIQIKDIDANRRLNTQDLVTVRLETDAKKYEARQGDVLFLARGHHLLATAITELLHHTVATGYFFILRPRTIEVRPRYLAWYINQSPFQSLLKVFMKGTRQPLVSRKDIENLEVELPSIKTQDIIVELDDLRITEQQLAASLQEKRAQLIQAFSINIARDSSCLPKD